MKTQHPLIAIFVFLCFSFCAFAQTTPAIIADWLDYAGISDTLTVIPIAVDDSANVISVGVMVNDTTGPDILISKVDSNGADVFKKTFSSPGFNRDQAVAVTVDDKCSIYIAGVVYSSATNFDWIILKYGYDGTLEWTYTLNGSANNYDAPAAIKIRNNLVYVTGEVYDSVTQLNYATIQLNRATGALNWKRQYDFHSLNDIAFAMDISETGIVKIAGASQDNLTKWNYCSLSYDSAGVANDTTRISGTANSFDRPMAVKCDALGNFYITGAGTDSAASFNARTVKIDLLGNVSWMVDYGSAGRDDEGNDLLVDDSGYVYVSGKSYPGPVSKDDYLLVKYKNSGTEQWHVTLDADSGDDAVNKMCFDSYGNIILTGKAKKDGTNDFRTVAYSKNGDLLWSIYFDGQYGGDDQATGITADANGNIFVSGESQVTDSTYQKVTIKYKTDYFLVPQDTIPAPSSLLFYPNQGQIIDDQGNQHDDLHAYTINQYPSLFFSQDSVSFVFSHIDKDTTTTDSMERITMNFVEGTLDKPYYDGMHEDQLLNYFLAQCPDGIADVAGCEKLMYSDAYEKTDVIFANNKSGMKFQIIMNKGAEPQAVLHFTGHQSLQLISNSDLKVNGILGSFTYERPLVYQLDGFGNRVSLGWLASYQIVDSANVSFLLPGIYDHGKPLVIECAKATILNSSMNPAPIWSTYVGGSSNDQILDIVFDKNEDLYITGYTNSVDFPTFPSLDTIAGASDIFLSKFDWGGQKIYSTFYGGYKDEVGYGLAYDKDGASFDKIYVVGYSTSPSDTQSGSFPSVATVDTNCFQLHSPFSGSAQGCIIQFDASTGLPTWATLFPGYSVLLKAASVDTNHNIFIGGLTPTYCIGELACQPDPSHLAYIPICDPGSGAYVEPSCNNRNVNQYNAGDGLILKFNSNGILKWSTFFGGENNVLGSLFDGINDIAVDTNNSFVYVTGYSTANTVNSIDTTAFCEAWTSSNFYHGLEQFPFCNPGSGAYFSSGLNLNSADTNASDAIIAKFSLNGNLLWSTFFGAYASDVGNSIAVNSTGDVYVVGSSEALFYSATNCGVPADTGFPTCHSSPQFSQVGPRSGPIYNKDDGFIAKFNSSGQLSWSTVFGGFGKDVINSVAIDTKDDVFICGTTTSDWVRGIHPIPVYNAAAFPYQAENIDSGGVSDGFIGVFKSDEDQVVCTYWGGTGNDGLSCIAAYGTAALATAGFSESYYDFHLQNPIGTADYFQPVNAGSAGTRDGVISTFNINPLVAVHENLKPSSDFFLYPNPTQSTFTIEGNLKDRKNIRIELLNYIGETISLYDLGEQQRFEKQIAVDNLNSGIYFVRIISSDNIQLGSKKIVIIK